MTDVDKGRNKFIRFGKINLFLTPVTQISGGATRDLKRWKEISSMDLYIKFGLNSTPQHFHLWSANLMTMYMSIKENLLLPPQGVGHDLEVFVIFGQLSSPCLINFNENEDLMAWLILCWHGQDFNFFT